MVKGTKTAFLSNLIILFTIKGSSWGIVRHPCHLFTNGSGSSSLLVPESLTGKKKAVP
jgi:hypothetical protein